MDLGGNKLRWDLSMLDSTVYSRQAKIKLMTMSNENIIFQPHFACVCLKTGSFPHLMIDQSSQHIPAVPTCSTTVFRKFSPWTASAMTKKPAHPSATSLANVPSVQVRMTMSAWEGPLRGQVSCVAGTTWGYNHRKMLEDVGSKTG